MSDSPSPSATARAIGIAGLVPFVAGAVALWTASGARADLVAAALAGYAATIAAFLGGMHWGIAARGGHDARRYAWGVVPSLAAWGALLLPARMGLVVLACTLVACYAVDRRVFPAQGLAGWRPLRAGLTLVAAACCAAGAVAIA